MTIRHRTADTTPRLNSLLLGSTNPDRLRAWYAEAFGVEADRWGFVELGPTGVMADPRDDVAEASAEPGRVILNLDVPDAKAAVERIEKAGTTWVVPLEEREPGWFATFTDPDGNYVQVIQMKPEMEREMLAEMRRDFTPTHPFVGFAVDDIPAAQAFYRDTLGLDVSEQNDMLAIWLSPAESVLVYPKPGHVPAQHTILNVPVDDIDDAVDSLTEAGVEMIRYDGFGQDDRGIARGDEGPPIAWFTDPAGNILSVLQLQ
ncbi:VOC family protein [Luteipulveratus flavus]